MAKHKAVRTVVRVTVGNILSIEQVRYGARYLAVCNLGQEQPGMEKSAKALDSAWDRCLMAHEADGIDCRPEAIEWASLLQRGDAFAVREVQSKLPWLFTAEQVRAAKAWLATGRRDKVLKGA